MNAPKFRPATKDDEELVRLLIFTALGEYGLDPAPKTTDKDLFDLEGYYAGGAFDVLVGPGGDIMGTLGLKRLDDTRCELRKMYLAHKHRGKGYGKRMLKHAMKRAADLGFRRVELETARVLKEAVALYEANGFKPFDNPAMAKRCDISLAKDIAA